MTNFFLKAWISRTMFPPTHLRKKRKKNITQEQLTENEIDTFEFTVT